MLTTYTLLSFVIAVLMWTLIGRGVLRLLIPGDPMKNPVYRLFTWALWPVLAPLRATLGRVVPHSHLGWYAFILLLALRIGLYMLFYSQGWLVLPANAPL
ncbi:hypothetical protein GCM10011521_18120 [Arenimonas soli]|uniref:YggT family protein n=1 Tax=Arenimonas soli TaxID=2269504 RepID=A0ABQ1HK78_9GAMM|nr:hypothetical protein [Arenimonas soli]GGA80232.1 hypothetical protein GCM10011521_18120 [Arenimonas soli]